MAKSYHRPIPMSSFRRICSSYGAISPASPNGLLWRPSSVCWRLLEFPIYPRNLQWILTKCILLENILLSIKHFHCSPFVIYHGNDMALLNIGIFIIIFYNWSSLNNADKKQTLNLYASLKLVHQAEFQGTIKVLCPWLFCSYGVCLPLLVDRGWSL
jgi:hypothetical protein